MIVNVMQQEVQAVQPREAHHEDREVSIADLSSISAGVRHDLKLKQQAHRMVYRRKILNVRGQMTQLPVRAVKAVIQTSD